MDPIELIKKILQALDQQEQEKDLPNANRMDQIDDVNQKTITQYSNSPDERYSTVDKVTTKAGGGANYPKHPADIRGEHPSQILKHAKLLETITLMWCHKDKDHTMR